MNINKREKKVLNEIGNINDYKNLKRTLIFTIVFCIIVILIVVYVQIYGQNKIVTGCSYLDPITIDLLAFFDLSPLLFCCRFSYHFYFCRRATAKSANFT